MKGVHIVSIMGNHGSFEKHFTKIITDLELLYHFMYMMFCVLGMFIHPFFYSVLVSIFKLGYSLNFHNYNFVVVVFYLYIQKQYAIFHKFFGEIRKIMGGEFFHFGVCRVAFGFYGF